MKFIQVLPFEYDKLDNGKMISIELEVIYLNIDQIKYISPIGETGRTVIKLLDNEEILSMQPLYQVLNQIKNAK
jgi:hypothetical protein